MKKKLIALLLCGVSIMSLSACSVKLTTPDGETKIYDSKSDENEEDDEDSEEDKEEQKSSKKSKKSSKNSEDKKDKNSDDEDSKDKEDKDSDDEESEKDSDDEKESKSSKSSKSNKSSRTERKETSDDDSSSKKTSRDDFSAKEKDNDSSVVYEDDSTKIYDDGTIEADTSDKRWADAEQEALDIINNISIPDFEESSRGTDDSEEVEQSKPSKKKASSSGDFWSNPSFEVEGSEFSLPADYSEMYDLGFDFNLADYGQSEDYKLKPYEYIYSTIRLENNDYDEDMYVYIGLLNDNESESVRAKECKINSLSFDILYGTNNVLDDVPEVYLNGITWGSSAEDCFEAFGEPYHEYESDSYTSYTFRNSEGDIYPSVDVTVHKTAGVVEIGVSTGNRMR